MRLKSLTAILAVAMMVVCLSGCTKSGGASSNADAHIVENAAVAYGMKFMDFNDVMSLMNEYDNEGAGYYVSKNVVDAQGIFLQMTNIGKELSGNITDVTFAAANENLGSGNFVTDTYQFTFTDADSARKYYNYMSMYYQDLNGKIENGEKDGFTYTIAYFGGSTIIMREGLYLKGNTFIFVKANSLEESKTGFSAVVFDKLGLVDPVTLK